MFFFENSQRRKKHNKIVLLTNSKLNGLEVLISQALIDSNISHDEFVSINNAEKILWYERKNSKFQ